MILKVVHPKIDTNIEILNIKVGSKVILKTGTYPKDPKAIEVTVMSGQSLGFIAAKKITAGLHPLANEVYDKIKSGMEATVSSITPECLIDVSINEKCLEKHYVSLQGNKIEYPNRIVVAAKAKSNDVNVNYSIIQDTIKFSYDGKLCGFASVKSSSALMKMLEDRKIKLDQSITDIMVFIKSADNIQCKVIYITPVCIIVEISGEIVKEESTNLFNVNKKVQLEDFIKDCKVDDAKEIKKRIDWLRKHKTPEYAVYLFINKLNQHKNIGHFKPTYIPQSNEVENFIAFSIADGIHHGNILCIGPAGSGKNQFITTMANLFDIPLIDQTCSSGIDEDTLFGYESLISDYEKPDSSVVNNAFEAAYRKFITGSAFLNYKGDKTDFFKGNADEIIEKVKDVLSQDKDDVVNFSVLCDAIRSSTSEVKFQPSILTKGLENACMIDLDEINTLRPQVTSSLHSALDGRRELLLNNYKKIKIDSDTIFTATMNEGGAYAGTQEMNLAFEDRFHIIEFKSPTSIEDILRMEVPSIPKASATKLDRLYKKMNQGRSEFDERTFSIRSFIYAAINVSIGNSVENAIKSVILPKIRNVDDRKTVETLIKDSLI